MIAADLWSRSRRELREALAAGHPIDPASLDDVEYRGVSLGLPAWVDRLAWKTFSKVFHRDPDTGTLRGWNVRMQQTGLDGAFEPIERDGEPWTFGHFAVVSCSGHRTPRGADRGLLIHYGQGGNGRFDPMSRVRDPIVAVNAGSADLLLGWSYVDLGFATLGTPAWFTLERVRPLTHLAHPPRRMLAPIG